MNVQQGRPNMRESRKMINPPSPTSPAPYRSSPITNNIPPGPGAGLLGLWDFRSEVTDFRETEDDRGATSLNMADWRPRWATCDGFSATSCPEAACTFMFLQRVGSGDGLIALDLPNGPRGHQGAERISAIAPSVLTHKGTRHRSVAMCVS